MFSKKPPVGNGKTDQAAAEGLEPDTLRPCRYVEPPAWDRGARQLVAMPGTPDESRFTFFDRIEIGRLYDGRSGRPGQLLVDDPTVSSRHCIISQTRAGRCFVRDVSRNGTRLNGRRLVPNQEIEVRIGQVVSIGKHWAFSLAGEASLDTDEESARPTTVLDRAILEVTILVGDIRDYTVLVREAPSADLQQSVSQLFRTLEREVVRLGGTVKEYQGDAIFAFWEKTGSDDQAIQACRAALALDRLARKAALDSSIWNVDGFALGMDWALTTGQVVIDSYGGASPGGLSMIGEPVVLAFRLEKFADEETGAVLACAATQKAAASEFEFRDLGKRHAKGFDEPDRVFSLVGARPQA